MTQKDDIEVDKPTKVKHLADIRRIAGETIPEDVASVEAVQEAHAKLLTELALVDELQAFEETDTPPLYLYQALINYYGWVRETRDNAAR